MGRHQSFTSVQNGSNLLGNLGVEILKFLGTGLGGKAGPRRQFLTWDNPIADPFQAIQYPRG